MRCRMLPPLLALAVVLGLAAPAAAVDSPAPGQDARCPVCGMYIAGYRNWVSSMVFKDGSRVFFDGPKDLFRYFFDLPKYRPGGTADDIAGLFVTEYYSVKTTPATAVFFVSGSDVLGPMGKELVPVAGLKQARGFMRDHNGVKLMRFDGSALVEVPAKP